MDPYPMGLIRTYRFTMLPGGAMSRVDHTYTYTGRCDLELELQDSDGVTRHYYPPRATRTVIWALPPPDVFVATAPVPVPTAPTLVTPTPAVSTPAVAMAVDTTQASGSRSVRDPACDFSLPFLGKRNRSEDDDTEDAARVSPRPMRVPRSWNEPHGPSGVWLDYIDDDMFDSTGLLRDMWDPAPEPLETPEETREETPEEDMSAAEEASADSDCREVVDVVSSPEVIEISSDSEVEEEDPSEPLGDMLDEDADR